MSENFQSTLEKSYHLFQFQSQFSSNGKLQLTMSCCERWRHKGSSFFSTPTEKLQNLQPAASKVIVLRLQHHQDSQVVIYIDPTL